MLSIETKELVSGSLQHLAAVLLKHMLNPANLSVGSSLARWVLAMAVFLLL
jgi:hypothetical protein